MFPHYYMKEHSSGCQTINPPESSILCPFIQPASGVHKNATRPLISSG